MYTDRIEPPEFRASRQRTHAETIGVLTGLIGAAARARRAALAAERQSAGEARGAKP